MPNTDQAQADPTDQPTVTDPLDAVNTPNNGTSALSDYEAEVASLSLEDLPGEPPEEEISEESEADESAEEVGEAANEESSEEDAPEEPEPGASNRFRIRAKDDVEAEALALRKRHPDLSLKDCIAKAELILGVKVKSEEAQEEVSEGDTVESVNSQIEELRRLRKEATSEMEFDTVSELTDKIDDLRDRREELKVLESQVRAEKDSKAQQSFDAEYKKWEDITVSRYPDTTNPDSAMVKRMVELDAQMRDDEDPIYHSPKKALILAQAVAVELGIIAAKPGPPPAKPSRSSKSPMQPAPGNRGTTASPSQRTEDAILSASSLDEYERLVGRG